MASSSEMLKESPCKVDSSAMEEEPSECAEEDLDEDIEEVDEEEEEEEEGDESVTHGRRSGEWNKSMSQQSTHSFQFYHTVFYYNRLLYFITKTIYNLK